MALPIGDHRLQTSRHDARDSELLIKIYLVLGSYLATSDVGGYDRFREGREIRAENWEEFQRAMGYVVARGAEVKPIGIAMVNLGMIERGRFERVGKEI